MIRHTASDSFAVFARRELAPAFARPPVRSARDRAHRTMVPLSADDAGTELRMWAERVNAAAASRKGRKGRSNGRVRRSQRSETVSHLREADGHDKVDLSLRRGHRENCA